MAAVIFVLGHQPWYAFPAGIASAIFGHAAWDVWRRGRKPRSERATGRVVDLGHRPRRRRRGQAMTGQRHSYADHPAVLILADHMLRAWSLRAVDPARCDCGWTGPSCDHPAHLADMLQQAGLLTDGTPPETPTQRVLAERADRTAPCCNAHHFEGCADGEPGCCPRCSINPWPTERTDGRTT